VRELTLPADCAYDFFELASYKNDFLFEFCC
jgi:hypothetical protein